MFLDIQCVNCGELHHNGPLRTDRCPECGGTDIVASPHDFEIDARFRDERANMLDRMDIDL